MGFVSGVTGLMKNLGSAVGIDASKISAAFSEQATSLAHMGQQAVKASRAESSKQIINMAINSGKLEGEVLEGAQKALKSTHKSDIIKMANNIAEDSNLIKTIDDEVFSKAAEEFASKRGAYAKIASDIGSGKQTSIKEINEFLGREGKDNLGIVNTAKGFFKDEKYGKVRAKTTLAAVGATAIGGRYLSGGNLTTNSRGEHDIAGLPFF